jgi:hypothetical protein
MKQGGYEKPPDLFVGDRFPGAYIKRAKKWANHRGNGSPGMKGG